MGRSSPRCFLLSLSEGPSGCWCSQFPPVGQGECPESALPMCRRGPLLGPWNRSQGEKPVSGGVAEGEGERCFNADLDHQELCGSDTDFALCSTRRRGGF